NCMCLGCLMKRQDLSHRWMQQAGGSHRDNISEVVASCVTHTDDRDALEHDTSEIDRYLLARELADYDVATIGRQRPERRREDATSDGIDHNVDPDAVSQFHHVTPELGALTVGQHVVGSGLTDRFCLPVTAGEPDDTRSRRFCNLN